MKKPADCLQAGWVVTDSGEFYNLFDI